MDMTQTQQNDVNQLNSFLRGEMSAVETYEQCIDKLDNNSLKSQLAILKASHSKRVIKLSSEVRRLGGEPADGSGAWGSFTKLVEGGAKMFGDKAAVGILEEGEDHGLADYRRDLEDLSPATKVLVANEILPEQRRTHDILSKIKSSLKSSSGTFGSTNRTTDVSKHEPVMAVGTFETAAGARAAIEALRARGIDDDSIGILTHDKDGDADVKTFKELAGNKAGTGAAIGAATGIGGGTLWAVGIAAGLLPAIGPVVAGGVLAAVAASAATGAAAGGLVGVLVGLGVSDEEAAYYDEEFKKGRTIVVVKDRKNARDAYVALHEHGSTNRYASRYV